MAGNYNINSARGERGQTIVEFALILLLLLVLLFGVTEFGRAWRCSNALTSAARAGVRFASTLPPNTSDFIAQVQDYTIDKLADDIDKDREVVTPGDVTLEFKQQDGTVFEPDFVNESNLPVEGTDTVTVTVNYDFNVLTGSIIPAFSGTKTLSRSATMLYNPR